VQNETRIGRRTIERRKRGRREGKKQKEKGNGKEKVKMG
jgi:hypothetical protein